MKGGIVMDFDSMSPIWAQVVKRIKSEIVTGKLPPGSKLPGGRDLALQYKINPNTAARVYQELERQGICQTKRGLGTYVTEDAALIDALRSSMAKDALEQFLTSLSAIGMSAQDAIQILENRVNQSSVDC